MLTEFFLSCFENLRQYRFRTFLTLLAIVIGSFSIVVMTSLAESGLATVTNGLEQLGGSRIIYVIPKQPERAKDKASYSKGLAREDIDLVKNRVPYVERIIAIRTLGSIEVRRRESPTGTVTSVVGTDEQCLAALDMKLAAGRGFVPEDLAESRRVILLGHELNRKLFGGENPVDREVTLFGATYRVIGLIARNSKLGVQLGFDWNDFGFIPEPTMTDREQLASPIEILITTTSRDHNEIVKRICNSLIERRHNGVDDFSFLDFNKLLAQFETIFILIQGIVAVISSIALVIGGVGIMNIMLVSVNQRMLEIGIRRAVGATPRNITLQFMLEASILAVSGSCIGIGLALGVVTLSRIVIVQIEPSWTGVVSLQSVVFAILAAVVVGNVFGYVPARRASRLVIDRCLRTARG